MPSVDAEGLEMALSELSGYVALFRLCRLGRDKGGPSGRLLPSVISAEAACRPGASRARAWGLGIWAGCHAGVLGQRPGGFDRGGPGLGCFPVCKMNTWGES